MIPEILFMAATSVSSPDASHASSDSLLTQIVVKVANANLEDPESVSKALGSRLEGSQAGQNSVLEGWIDYVVSPSESLPRPLRSISYRIFWEKDARSGMSRASAAKLDLFVSDDQCLEGRPLIDEYSKASVDEFANAQTGNDGTVFPIKIEKRRGLVKYRADSKCIHKIFLF